MKYTKMWRNKSWEYIQEDRVERFLSEGWTLEKQPAEEKKVTKSKSTKDKITASAQVTSKETSDKEVIEDPEMDTLTFNFDDFETAKKED